MQSLSDSIAKAKYLDKKLHESIVNGFIRNIQPLLNRKIIPKGINLICLDFYHIKLDESVNDKRESDGATPLFVACREGNDDSVQKLLSNDLTLINEPKTNGRTPLFIASFFGHLKIIEMLIKHSEKMVQKQLNHGILDVNKSDSKGFAPLFVASQNGHTNICKLLLQNNANINEQESKGHNPLWIASLRGHANVVEELLSHPEIDINHQDLSGVTALWAACQNNNCDVVNLLLNHSNNANPNLAKHDGCTPLWIAASRGTLECVQLLLEHGADVNKSDRSQGATPLFVACQNGKKQTVDLLLKGNADVSIPRSGDGTTPLMMASHNGHFGIVQSLLKSDADPMKANTTGLNSFGCATMQGHTDVVKIIYNNLLNNHNLKEVNHFVNCGDDVNGWTPLHLACMGGHENVVKYLINTIKVDVYKKCNENKTALEHAWQNGHQSIVQLLSQYENNENANNQKEEKLQNESVRTDDVTDDNVIIQNKIAVDRYAKLKGLVKIASFNGRVVKVIAYNEEKSRWKVKLLHTKQENKFLGVKEENLEVISDYNDNENINLLKVYPSIGDKVKTIDGKCGIVKYIGNVEFDTKDIYIGLELEQWDPNGNNGTIIDKTYFDALDGHGYFVKLEEIFET